MDENFSYEPKEGDPLSRAVVSAVAMAHNERILEQEWILSNNINTDALDKLFQDGHLNMTLQLEADRTAVIINADQHGEPVIEIGSHR